MGKEPFQWVCFKADKWELFLEPSTGSLFQEHRQGFEAAQGLPEGVGKAYVQVPCAPPHPREQLPRCRLS